MATQGWASRWDLERLKQVLRRFSGVRVLVVGDLGIDRYTLGDVERVSPEAPVPIVAVQEVKVKLGLAANVADNVQVLGGTALLSGVIGSDRNASDFRRLLKRAGVSTSGLVVDRSRMTVVKDRVVSDRQQLLRIDYENLHPLDSRVEREVLKRVAQGVRAADVVILEDYAKGFLSARLAREIFRIARSKKKWVAVDPNAKTPLAFYRGAHVLTPNTREAERLTGIEIVDPKTLAMAGRKLLSETGARYAIITRGREGMAIFTRGSTKSVLIPTFAREVYDVSGAGDTVISVLTLALASGATVEEAAVLGNMAAGVEVGKRGTATVSPEEIEAAMEFFNTRMD